mmetsp:Transcript_23727/g.35397  ORF Transcript_23727/g.35397 Transcript_23727/m.35397 type:complete len:361 (-) Transcript_23727:79-1161(-)
MRFLLHAATKSSRSNQVKHAKDIFKTVAATSASPSVLGVSQPQHTKAGDEDQLQQQRHHQQKQHQDRVWGQQCSPDCGCVIRFESELAPSMSTHDDIVTKSSYEVKKVVSTRHGPSHHLQPHLTTKKRPLLTKCVCPTLHNLATRIVEHTQGKTLSSLRNEAQFESTRCSIPFRHTVLRESNLNISHTHCFDLVEEAYIAMLWGYMPRERRETEEIRMRALPTSVSNEDEDNSELISSLSMTNVNRWNGAQPGWSGYGSHGHGIGAVASSSPHGAAAEQIDLSMLNFVDGFDDERGWFREMDEFVGKTSWKAKILVHDEDNSIENNEHLSPRKHVDNMDWVSYIDELHWSEEEEKQQYSE